MTCRDITYINIKIKVSILSAVLFFLLHILSPMFRNFAIYFVCWSVCQSICYYNMDVIAEFRSDHGLKDHTDPMKCSFSTHSDFSVRLPKMVDHLQKFTLKHLALSTSYRHHWGHHQRFLQGIPPYRLLNIFPDMHILQQKSRKHYSVSGTSISCR